jgi:hypothetical protein
MYSLRLRQKVAAAGFPLIDEDCNCCDRDCISFSSGVEGLGDIHQDRRHPRSGNMSLSGRYPEHDTCENFNAIDVRELQRKNLLRPGLCFTNKWFRDGAPSGDILIKAQPDAIMLPRSPSRRPRIEGCRAASPYRLDKMPRRRPPALVQMPYHCRR